MLYRSIKKNQNKIFWTIGQFEFEYFGDSNVLNKLLLTEFLLFSLQIRTPFNYLLMNLVVAESIITIYGLPTDFLASYHFGWKMGKTLCLVSGVLLTISGKAKIYFGIPNFLLIWCQLFCLFVCLFVNSNDDHITVGFFYWTTPD